MAEWAWDGDEFAALWLSDGRDRIPGLLSYTSRFEYREDFDRYRVEVSRRYDDAEKEYIQLALNTLTASDMRLEIFGGTNRYKGSSGADRMYRIVGARTVSYGAVLWQYTEAAVDGRIRLRLCRPEALPAQVVAAVLPYHPGSGQPITVHPDDIRTPRPSRTGTGPVERYQQLMDTLHGAGSAQLLLGAFNTAPAPVATGQWFDADDGRYLETRTEHITLRPAAPQDLSGRFASWIENALSRLRAEEYDSW